MIFASEKSILEDFLKQSKTKFNKNNQSIKKILNQNIIFNDDLSFLDLKETNLSRFFISSNSYKIFDNITDENERRKI